MDTYLDKDGLGIYQKIEGATHSLIAILLPLHYVTVVQQAFQKASDGSDKRLAMLLPCHVTRFHLLQQAIIRRLEVSQKVLKITKPPKMTQQRPKGRYIWDRILTSSSTFPFDLLRSIGKRQKNK